MPSPSIATREPLSSTRSRLTLRNLVTPNNRRGQVDGAWWPSSTDLAASVPQLVSDAADAGVEICRVMYCLEDWPPTTRRVYVGGRLVRLGGYHTQPAGTLLVVDSAGRRLELRLIAADTDAEQARNRLNEASEPSSGDSPQQALGAR
jgi:hypothetical protein